jgi:subtilisin family serine protease
MPYYLLGTVSDPAYTSTWSLSTIQANRAWDLTTGSNATTVAVIDTGFALNHEELASKWKTNSGEVGTTQSGESC